LDGLRADFRVAAAIRKTQKRVAIGDIEIIADERHTDRRV
jgi:hypothetical protein